MAITRKQRLAMAIVVLAGALGIAAVLWTDRARPGGDEHAQAGHDDDAHGHAEKDGGQQHHGKEEHDKEDHGNEAHGKEADDKHAHAEENPGEDHDAAHGTTARDTGKDAHDDEERRVTLTDAQLKASGIAVRAAGPARLRPAASFPGEIRFDEDRTAHVVPRLAGVAESVPARLGETVRKGQVLAVISSSALSDQRSELLTAQRRRDAARIAFERERRLWQEKISAEQDYRQAETTLQEADIAVRNAAQKLAAIGAPASASALNRFEVRAPFAGVVVEKHLSQGESVGESASIFTVSDLSRVQAEFVIAPKDLPAVRVGQTVVVSSTAFEGRAEGTIAYIGALLGEQTRTARARVTLANPQGAWRPGLFVTVAVLGDDEDAAVAVGAEALQTIDAQPMLFMTVPGGFVARPVKTGRSDGRTVEILDGLKAGESYAASNTFVLKSELGKAGAEHAH